MTVRPCRRQLLDTLAAGTTLVVDRYAYSGAAFTAAKGVPGLDLPWCKVKVGCVTASQRNFLISNVLQVPEAAGSATDDPEAGASPLHRARAAGCADSGWKLFMRFQVVDWDQRWICCAMKQ